MVSADCFRPFFALVSTKGLNVGIDLMYSFLCKTLPHIGFCTNFGSQPLETVECRFMYIYTRLYSHLYGPMSQVLHNTCPKFSNFRNVGRVKSI